MRVSRFVVVCVVCTLFTAIQGGQYFPRVPTEEAFERSEGTGDVFSQLHQALSASEWVLVLTSPQEKKFLSIDQSSNSFPRSQVEITNSALALLRTEIIGSPQFSLFESLGVFILQSSEESRKMRSTLLIPRADSGTAVLVHSAFVGDKLAKNSNSRTELQEYFLQNPVCRSQHLGEPFPRYFMNCLAYYQSQKPWLPQISDAVSIERAVALSSTVVVILPTEQLSDNISHDVSSYGNIWSKLQEDFPNSVLPWVQLESSLDWHTVPMLQSKGELSEEEDVIGFICSIGASPLPLRSTYSKDTIQRMVATSLRNNMVEYATSVNVHSLADGAHTLFILVVDQTKHQNLVQSFKNAELSRTEAERRKNQIRFLWTDNADLLFSVSRHHLSELPALIVLRDDIVYSPPIEDTSVESDFLQLFQSYNQHPFSVPILPEHPNYLLAQSQFETVEGCSVNHLVLLYQPACGSCSVLRHAILPKLKQMVSHIPSIRDSLQVYEWNVNEAPFPPHLHRLVSNYPLTEVPAVLLFPACGEISAQQEATRNVLSFSKMDSYSGTSVTRGGVIYQDSLSLRGILEMLQQHMRLIEMPENDMNAYFRELYTEQQ